MQHTDSADTQHEYFADRPGFPAKTIVATLFIGAFFGYPPASPAKPTVSTPCPNTSTRTAPPSSPPSTPSPVPSRSLLCGHHQHRRAPLQRQQSAAGHAQRHPPEHELRPGSRHPHHRLRLPAQAAKHKQRLTSMANKAKGYLKTRLYEFSGGLLTNTAGNVATVYKPRYNR